MRLLKPGTSHKTMGQFTVQYILPGSYINVIHKTCSSLTCLMKEPSQESVLPRRCQTEITR